MNIVNHPSAGACTIQYVASKSNPLTSVPPMNGDYLTLLAIEGRWLSVPWPFKTLNTIATYYILVEKQKRGGGEGEEPHVGEPFSHDTSRRVMIRLRQHGYILADT